MRTNTFQTAVIGTVVISMLAACGGPSSTAKPTDAPKPAATQPPTAAPTAAPKPTDLPKPTEAPKPTATPLPGVVDAPRTNTVTALYYTSDGKTAKGGSRPVKILVEPNTSKQFRVGFFESEVGGSGPQWRASGWLATLVSAMLTGFDPSQTQVSYDIAGYIDGPSAGGLMTVGTLAGLRGDKVLDEVAMTGTINPDGTIGPVGGIPQKIEGAAAAGKKVVVIPVGRVEGGVDLIEHGKKNNVEVKEVGDIYQAYELLTGKKLPRSTSAERPQVTGPIYERMRAKTSEWNARYAEMQGQVGALPDNIKTVAVVQNMALTAKEYADQSKRLSDQGLIGGAYGKASQAAAFAALASGAGRIIQEIVTQGPQGALKQLQQNQAVEAKIKAVADRLKSESPKNLAQAGALITAYSTLIDALNTKFQAESVLERQIKTQDEAIEVLTQAALLMKIVDLRLEQAKDAVDLGSVLEGEAWKPAVPIANVAEFFSRAAEANIALFDSLIVDDVSKSMGVNMDTARALLMSRDQAYAGTLQAARTMPNILSTYFGKGDASDYAKLGGAIAAYSASTSLIAKYYSLDAQLDKDLNVVGIGKERSLLNMLDLADEQARGSIATLKTNKVDPGLFIIGYETARLSREGDMSDKMDALQSYWNSYIQTRALAYLGGFAGK